MAYIFKTHGTCSSRIELELEGNILKKVSFYRGCDGNSQGIAKLVEGMTVEEVKKKLTGIRCEGKPTSCPDQLAKAVEEAYMSQQKNK
ncbi:MAG: TIGR03905 family TSCPD domain-containing protein [Bacillota bacterium]